MPFVHAFHPTLECRRIVGLSAVQILTVHSQEIVLEINVKIHALGLVVKKQYVQ